MLLLGKEIVGNPIVSLENGEIVGHVKDLFIDKALHVVEAAYLGSKGMFNRQTQFVSRERIAILGRDTVLVESGHIVLEGDEAPGWLRRDDLRGREVDTPGGTRIGQVDDVILDEKGRIAGLSLGRVYVSGPIAQNRAIKRAAILDVGAEDSVITVNLSRAEAQKMGVTEPTLFSESTVKMSSEATDDSAAASERERVQTPYTTTIAEDEGKTHATPEEPYKSPYVTGEPEESSDEKAGYKSPYATPRKVELTEEGTFKSPYTTPEEKPE